MNFLTLPNRDLPSDILSEGFFARADLPAHIARAFERRSLQSDALINVALSSVHHTAPTSDAFYLPFSEALGLDRNDFEINDRIEIAVHIFDENGDLQNFGSTDLTIFVDEFLNDGTVLFGITTWDLSHGRVNPSEVARLNNEAVVAYCKGETDEMPACLVERLSRLGSLSEAPKPEPETETETETETVTLERRNHDDETELVQTINKACYMQGAQTRGLACYDDFVEEYFGDWISVLDDAVGGLGDYINSTLFSTRRDLQAKRTLEKAYDKGMRKLDKYCGTEG